MEEFEIARLGLCLYARQITAGDNTCLDKECSLSQLLSAVMMAESSFCGRPGAIGKAGGLSLYPHRPLVITFTASAMGLGGPGIEPRNRIQC
jgi:hypothetical protein